jgi:hypothetical protein
MGNAHHTANPRLLFIRPLPRPVAAETPAPRRCSVPVLAMLGLGIFIVGIALGMMIASADAEELTPPAPRVKLVHRVKPPPPIAKPRACVDFAESLPHSDQLARDLAQLAVFGTELNDETRTSLVSSSEYIRMAGRLLALSTWGCK